MPPRSFFLPDYHNELLNDSKQLTDARRRALRPIIEQDALAWASEWSTAEDIDRINILNAAILAMHRALDDLQLCPECIIVDGNRFKPYVREVLEIPHTTIVKGDAKYLSIAAASVLAKTYRRTIIWLRCTKNTPTMRGIATPVTRRRRTVRRLLRTGRRPIIVKAFQTAQRLIVGGERTDVAAPHVSSPCLQTLFFRSLFPAPTPIDCPHNSTGASSSAHVWWCRWAKTNATPAL